MTKWIDDAKKQAVNQKQKLVLSNQKQRQREIISFRKITLKARNEIEKVLSRARKQGIEVSSPIEGWTSQGAGDFWSKTESDQKDKEGRCTYIYHLHYAVIWELKMPKTTDLRQSPHNTLYITLSTSTKNLLSVQKIDITASEVEAKIKSWLIQVYSEQK